MTKTAVEIVWKGSEALRPFLVPIESLEPFPGNPRRGDVERIRGSLHRFGQAKPITVAAGAEDGPSRIVAGHHVRLAAIDEGWTHVAVLPHEFESDEEARAFLLADNRIPEFGSFEDDLLLAQLREVDSLEGTGYSAADVERLDAEIRELHAEQAEPPPRLDEREEAYSTQPRGFEVPLYLVGDQRREFAQQVKLLEREWGIKGVTDVVVRAVRDAAQSANS